MSETTRDEVKVHVRFWIKSSRGTDKSAVVELPADYERADIKCALENWCSQFGAWHVSENHISYGFDLLPSDGYP